MEAYDDCTFQRGTTTPAHRGIALIISMEKSREGAESDRGRLEMLAKFLLFDPTTIVDRPAGEVKTEIAKHAMSAALQEHDFFLCFVNAHGSTDEKSGPYILDDSEPRERVYVLEDIVEPFKRCKFLFNKPKVFFINACRGHYTLSTSEPRGTSAGLREPALRSNSKVVEFLGARSDTLIMFSTDEGDKSWRDERGGTSFVRALCESFAQNSEKMHLEDIATDVRLNLTELTHRVKQGAGILHAAQNAVSMSTLTKHVYWRRHDPTAASGKIFPPSLVTEHVLHLYDSKLDISEFGRASLVDVIFFHGYEFGNSMSIGYPAALSSWMTRSQHGEREVCWPVDWLPGSDRLGLPLRIFSVTYNGLQVTPRGCDSERYLESTAEILQRELFVLQGKLGLGQDRGLVLVGHGLGGLLIKSILDPTNCADYGKLQMLRRHLIGVAFYAVPCLPSELPQESAPSSFSVTGLEKGLKKANGVSALMTMDELGATLLNPKQLIGVQRSFKEMKEKVKVFLEQQDTYGIKIADHYNLGEFYCSRGNEMPIKANHFDICRPSSRGDNNFVFLVDFIKKQHKLYAAKGVYEDQPVQHRFQKTFIVGQQKYFKDLKESMMSADQEGKHILGITGDNVYGVYGMGGIGKTTLAKSLQNDEEIQQYFSSHVYFVSLKKDPSIPDIQGFLMYQICKEMPTTKNEDILRDQLQSQLQHLPKFLLFLDDVWDKAHVDRLLGEDFINGLPGGSRCIITTRLKSELWKFKATLTVEVDFLSDEESRRLFCHHAFPGGHTNLPKDIPGHLAQVVEEVITGCNRLPLTLVAIGEERRGSMLLETWQATRDKLRLAKDYANPYDQAIQCVKVSYDSLPEYYIDANLKDMFLDFAAFPEREEIEICLVMDLWKRQGLSEKAAVAYLEQLEARCMLKLTGYWCYVHDIFRAMAVKLIQQGPVHEWKRLFAWGVTDRLPEKWTSSLSTHGVERRAVSSQLGLCGSFSWLFATVMNCLLYTQVEDWAAQPFRCEKLVISRTGVRQFHSLDCQLFTHLGQLRTLVLSANHSLECLPAEIGCLKMLERLDLSWCFALESLPGEIGQLSQLKKLNLAGCFTLAALPRETGNLLELTDLDLRSTGIVELPPEIAHLAKLKRLNVKDANKLQFLPAEIGQLRALKTLDAALTRISEVPKELGQLMNLKHLSLEGCGGIMELPRELARLKNLISLNCINSVNLKVVPNDLDRLVTEGKLRYFNIYNTAVVRNLLPPGLRGLPEPFSGGTKSSDDEKSSTTDSGEPSTSNALDKPASKQKFYLSLFAAGTKEDRRAAFGLARMVQLAQLETFNNTRMKMAIRMIYTMANDHSTRHTVIRNGGLPVLLRCLLEGEPGCAAYAASTLCNICVSGTTVSDVVDANGLSIITRCINERGAAGNGAKQALDWILQYRSDCTQQVIDLLEHIRAGPCPCGYCWYTLQERQRHRP